MTVHLAEARPHLSSDRRRPWRLALQGAAMLGVAWNAFGVLQWLGSLTASTSTLMGRGLSAEQAAVYLGLPGWMTVSFAAGVFGGLIGSLALVMRRRAATPWLTASLLAYVALYAGDAWHGLFAVMPSQQPILNAVLAIAAALLAAAVAARRQGLLR